MDLKTGSGNLVPTEPPKLTFPVLPQLLLWNPQEQRPPPSVRGGDPPGLLATQEAARLRVCTPMRKGSFRARERAGDLAIHRPGRGWRPPQTCLPRPGPAPPTAKKREWLAQPSLLAPHRPGGASRHLPLPGPSRRARRGPRSATEFAMTLVTLSFCTPQTWVDVQCLSFSCTNAAPSLPHPSPPPGGPFPAPGPRPQALVPRRPARTGKRGKATQTKPPRGLKSLKTYQPLSRSPVQP